MELYQVTAVQLFSAFMWNMFVRMNKCVVCAESIPYNHIFFDFISQFRLQTHALCQAFHDFAEWIALPRSMHWNWIRPLCETVHKALLIQFPSSRELKQFRFHFTVSRVEHNDKKQRQTVKKENKKKNEIDFQRI